MLFATPTLDAREQEVLGEIESLKQNLSLYLRDSRRWTGSLRRLSFARAIQGSNSIEGYEAALDDAAAVALGEEPLDATEETRLALVGYRDAMTYVLQLADDAEFEYSPQLLKSLHFMMTSYSLSNRPGQWRAGSIYVNKEKTGEIVYEGPELELVSGLVSELTTLLEHEDDALPDRPHQIVRGAMAHLNLVMIHPFRDGNGRMARCLQSLVLARGGVLSPVFMSIEEYLGRNTQGYYGILEAVGRGSWQPNNDARPWLRFSLTAHLRQARTMLRRVKEAERLWVDLENLLEGDGRAPRCIYALWDAAQGLRVRNSTYRAALKDAGDEITLQTGTRDLGDLVASGLLEARGQARGRHYTLGPGLKRVRRTIVQLRDPRDDSDPFA
jgi:Fic family protein